jgi:hypothetical protein
MKTMKIVIAACAMIGMASGAAFAQKGSGTGSGSATAEKKPAGMQMPKAPQELLDMAKNMGGTWKCTGKVHLPDGAMDYTATVRGKLDLDKLWWHETLTQTKTKQPYKFEAYMTYDAAAKKWNRVSVDNMGVFEAATSDDAKSWTGTSSGMGMTMKTKATVTPGDKTMHFESQASMDGKTYMPTVEMDCKK